MKKLTLILTIALLIAGSRSLDAQNWPEEYLGLPGDNLNLYAVMDLFQNSETLEAFERELNNADNMINNLDLNGDRLVDYIMVLDYQEGNIHNIVLRVALNQNEYQDVAVFVVEKLRNGAVQIQLIGDEALYGKNYIIEPNYAERPNPGYTGGTVQTVTNQRGTTVVHTTYYEVASWPVIVYMSRPVYRPWRSSWRWGYYPVYWSPWAPHYWHYYYGYHYNWYGHYYSYYRPWGHHRCKAYHHTYYSGIRNYSPTIVVNINTDRYRDTYSRPERRADGEKLFAQRRATGGTTVPARGYSRLDAQSRAQTTADTRVSPRANTRETTVASNRTERQAVRTGTEATRQNGRTQSVRTGRTAAPDRQVSSRPVERRSSTEVRGTQNRTQRSAAVERNTRSNRTSNVSTRPSGQTRSEAVSPARSSNNRQASVRSQTTQRSSQPAAVRSGSSSTSKRTVSRSSSNNSRQSAVRTQSSRSSSQSSAVRANTSSRSDNSSVSRSRRSGSSRSSGSTTSGSRSGRK